MQAGHYLEHRVVCVCPLEKHFDLINDEIALNYWNREIERTMYANEEGCFPEDDRSNEDDDFDLHHNINDVIECTFSGKYDSKKFFDGDEDKPRFIMVFSVVPTKKAVGSK